MQNVYSKLRIMLAVTAFSVPVFASGPDAEGLSEIEARGKAAYTLICATCHGAKGEGEKGPPLVPFVYLESQLIATVRSGQGEMPALPAAVISDEDILAMVAYLTALEEE